MAYLVQPMNNNRIMMMTYHKDYPPKLQNRPLNTKEFKDINWSINRSPRNETIHSGHFMMSEIDEVLTDKHEKCINDDTCYPQVEQTTEIYYDGQEPSQTFVYRSKSNNCVSIDSSLTKLFQCMSLAYNDGKITSPKWKTFKGLKLHVKDRIRLNNIIWRAWHIQYIAGHKPVVCQFSSNLESDRHKKTEAILLEGKYWKRKANVVKAEYKKWRTYYYNVGKMQTISAPSSYDWENNLPRWSNNLSFDSQFFTSNSADSNQFYQNILPNAYTNFYDYTNSREISRSGMGAEFMQPGLEQLQPNVDFMDTFGPINDMFSRFDPLPTVKEESYNANIHKDDYMDSLFVTDNEQSASQINKSLIDSNVYSTRNIFEPSNDLGINGNSIVESQTIQNFETVSKISAQNNYSYCDSNNFGTNNLPQNSIAQIEQSNSPKSNLYKVQYDNTNQIQQQHLDSNCQSFLQRFELQKINQDLSNTNMNTISTSGLPFYEPDLSIKNTKSKQNVQTYFLNDFQTNNDKHLAHISSHSTKNLFPKRLRTRSSSVNSTYKNSTIKSLLNKPSLVSTVIPSKTNSSSSFTHNSQSNQMRFNVERSHSLPVSGQKRREVNQPAVKNHRNNVHNVTANQFDTGSKGVSYNYSSNMSNIFSNTVISPASTSPSSESSYSNPDSQQCLPPTNINLSSSKYSKHHLSHACDKSTDSTIHNNFMFVNELNKNRLVNLEPLTSLNLYQTHANASSTSTSPIESRDSYINAPTNSQMDSSSVTIQNIHQHSQIFNRLMKSDRQLYPAEFDHDSTQNTFSSVDNSIIKDNVGSESMSPFQNETDLTLQKEFSDELAFKQLTNLSFQSSNVFNTSFRQEDRSIYKERRRVCHINAEQKRRCNIKNGFDTLRNLLPSLNSSVNLKISKAAMLHKAADYIRLLKNEKYEQQQEYDLLKQQVENLNQSISMFQNQLPATGAPITGQRSSQIKEHYSDYVRSKTIQNWKFWIFSIIMESLLDSYCNTVSTTNFEEMCKTLLRWLDQSCCLITLRKDVLNSLRFISTSTNILNNPCSLPEEVLMIVTNPPKDEL